MSREDGNYLNLSIRKNNLDGNNNIEDNYDNKNNNNNSIPDPRYKNILDFNFDVKKYEIKLSYRDIISLIDIINLNMKFKKNEEFLNLLNYLNSSSYSENMDEFNNGKLIINFFNILIIK
jgi:hypothetical protein